MNQGRVTHHNQKYDLGKIFELVKNKKISFIDVSELQWILNFTQKNGKCNSCRKGLERWHRERMNDADLTFPIVVLKEKRCVTLDGIHRLEKALEEGYKRLPFKEITKEELEKCRTDILCKKCKHDTTQWLGKGETINGDLTCGHGRDYNDPCGCFCELKD